MRGKAFTLVELLVVIAILALLAGISVPAFVKAKHRGKQAACAAHLKQTGYAVQMYLSDWEDRLFPADYWLTDDRLSTYSREPRVHKCVAGLYPYGLNTYLFLGPTFAMSLTEDKTQVLLMMDASGLFVLPRPHGRLMLDPIHLLAYPVCDPPYVDYWRNVRSAHDPVTNVLFLDWHVRAYRTDYLLDEFRQTSGNGIWNPYKFGVNMCPQ